MSFFVLELERSVDRKASLLYSYIITATLLPGSRTYRLKQPFSHKTIQSSGAERALAAGDT